MSLLKEYISQSRNIDFLDSLENMINDNNISSQIKDQQKFPVSKKVEVGKLIQLKMASGKEQLLGFGLMVVDVKY